MTLSRTATTLPQDLEETIQLVIGSCIGVHRHLGPGMTEQVYSLACARELEARGVSFERECSIPIRYPGETLCHYRLDFLVDDCVILELKSVDRIHPLHG